MTLEQQVDFMSIYFICFIPITYLSFRWVYVLMCQTAGKTVEEVREKKREISRSTIDLYMANLHELTGAYLEAADINQDGLVDDSDYQLCIDISALKVGGY